VCMNRAEPLFKCHWISALYNAISEVLAMLFLVLLELGTKVNFKVLFVEIPQQSHTCVSDMIKLFESSIVLQVCPYDLFVC